MAITTAVKGLENKTFGECLAGATIADPDGVMVPFPPFKDLLANKKTVRWAKGQRYVLELEKIKKYPEEKGEE